MLLENYDPVAWTNGGIEAVKTLWTEHIADRSYGAFNRKKRRGWCPDDLLNDARASCDLFKSCA
jgi:hypothetical protein